MYEWGAGINRSFAKKNSTGERYLHVRFEGAPGILYKKFRITVEPVDGADISTLRHIAACVGDLSRFKPESVQSVHGAYLKHTYVYLNDVACVSQHDQEYPESSGWCSPASVAQVVEYFTGKPVDLPSCARAVFDEKLGIYGSWPFNTALSSVYLPEHICYVTHLSSIKSLVRLLAKGYPVIVSLCCREPLPGAPKAYDKGHLLTVVGYDLKKDQILCHDTAEKEPAAMIKHYPLEPFMRAWENRQRLAYVILPAGAQVIA
jgi:hypothetical protein